MQKYTPFQYFSLVILLFSSGCVTGSRPPRDLSSPEVRPVIAVMEFDNRSGYSGQWNLGSGMADLLVSELMASGKYRVVERQRIGKVLGPVKVITDPVIGDEPTRLPGPDLGQLRILEVTGDIAIAEAVKGDAFPRGARFQMITPETF